MPEPTPAPDSTSEDELLLKDQDSELEYADAIHEGLEYVCSAMHYDYLTFDEAAEYALKTSYSHEHEPNTLREAMERPNEGEHWYRAAMKEIQSLIENGTFELVQLPPGRKAIGSDEPGGLPDAGLIHLGAAGLFRLDPSTGRRSA